MTQDNKVPGKAGRPWPKENRVRSLCVRIRPEVDDWLDQKSNQSRASKSLLVDALLAACQHMTISDINKLVEARQDKNVRRPIKL